MILDILAKEIRGEARGEVKLNKAIAFEIMGKKLDDWAKLLSKTEIVYVLFCGSQAVGAPDFTLNSDIYRLGMKILILNGMIPEKKGELTAQHDHGELPGLHNCSPFLLHMHR